MRRGERDSKGFQAGALPNAAFLRSGRKAKILSLFRPRAHLTCLQKPPPPTLCRWSGGFAPESVKTTHAPAGFIPVERWLNTLMSRGDSRSGPSFPEGMDLTSREAQSSLHRPEVGGGARIRKGVAGAESRRHRHKVGGGRNFSPCRKLRCAPRPGGASRALPVLTEQKRFARNRLPKRDTTCRGCARRSGAGSSGTLGDYFVWLFKPL
jgi:hypothetical protein